MPPSPFVPGHTDLLNALEVATLVAEHKTWFFAAKDTNCQPIDYHAAVTGGLTLVSQADVLASRKAD